MFEQNILLYISIKRNLNVLIYVPWLCDSISYLAMWLAVFVYGRVFKDYPPQDHWYLTLSSVRCAQRDLFSAGTNLNV